MFETLESVVNELDNREQARIDKELEEKRKIREEREAIEALNAAGKGPTAPPVDFDENAGFEEFDDFDLPPAPKGPPSAQPLPTPPPRSSSSDLLPPPPPPSYEDLLNRGLSGLNTDPHSTNGGGYTPNPSGAYALPPPPPPLYPSVAPPSGSNYGSGSTVPTHKIKKWSLPIIELTQQYYAEWEKRKASKLGNVYMLETHQGKTKTRGLDSTNGCTVIAPLIASAHITSLGGVSDSTVEEVIDYQAPPILKDIRSRLGLSNGALIIPSDVHDYLFDKKIIEAESFIGVSGGNIMDEGHVKELLKCLNENGSAKAAAALFFHAHVVCITKMATSEGEVWYDLIDSLPRKEDANKSASGVRIRCKDADTLLACIKWYASHKFGPSDQEYIDKNEWDEDNCDFDPRVFQSFVWGDLKK